MSAMFRGQREMSTWRIAAGRMQRKWVGMKQRTTWRFKQRKSGVVFQVDGKDAPGEMHLRGKNVPLDDLSFCHNVLANASPETLNGILGAISPEGSDRFCTTMTCFMFHNCAPRVRSMVLDVLSKSRLPDISLPNRGVIIRSIQQQLLSPLVRQKSEYQTAAFNILKGTHGVDLTLLKEDINAENSLNALQDGFRGGDLYQLIYGAKDMTQVVSVMQHIAVESLKVSMAHSHKPLIKIMSDIDDTLFAGWADQRYPAHVLYPGVSHLYRSIAHGVDKAPSVTFLTARPRGFFSLGRTLTADHLVSLGMTNPTVLNGSVQGLVSNAKIAGLKLQNFERYATLFPEYKFVFFGDAGQGDALLASRLLHLYPDKVPAVFIHDIAPQEETTGDGGAKDTYRAQGVVFYETYAGAGLAAYEKGLVSREALLSLLDACTTELDQVPFLGAHGPDKRARRLSELDTDRQKIQQLSRC
ncbi:hypothetical protein SDRG_06678 [Saprolegnia diclina VS20]|uniref:Phosphatidate phosphatase APP1 catalytic domain-containing protein n=1 Tax=Saprolegnia diclina (strain VS20) TaxID=1156394 RepID=T0RZS2_SAPDV|nr:hypothetical protein SDRG_06678 [Saprolegnia diclina VS20]EQC35932.1 hypothetical protein SDRG_06678 [Saprolegnia diclina VS20]|eukprot:XP_008610694.1 hypothetical protein SDRG_06678 [Saprolegnia diclina VS20]